MKRFFLVICLTTAALTLSACGFNTGCDVCGGSAYSFNYAAPSCCGGTPW